ncbi:MAG TPA: hypothetical protein VHZ51_02425 [Ktedonobacteraceae bacterium]|jgi:hypothetical protein|nr:hypothetical protein [Ktedonobacteraceae bacterium]
MSESFAELYRDALKGVFIERARQQLEQGSDALTSANAYAERGKPEFVLAFLLLTESQDEVKREVFAHAFERRAHISAQKAASFDAQYHRPFPLIQLEAQKDLRAAKQVREGQPLQGSGKERRLD